MIGVLTNPPATAHAARDQSMRPVIRSVLFLLFFISGWCGLVYQVVWTRLAFAAFGIITPVLSVVLSVFMLGLAAGAWLAGRLVGRWTAKIGGSALGLYAGVECLIGIGAFAVPKLFAFGEQLLLAAGQSNSFIYLALSAVVLTLAILPWCLCMGATFPLMMAYWREQTGEGEASFSFLYLANVLGAMCGALVTAVVLVELLGFGRTLAVAAVGNFVVALAAAWLASRTRRPATTPLSDSGARAKTDGGGPRMLTTPRLAGGILFATGFSALAMEVVWARAFTPVLKTQVYSFAAVVCTYLGATALGSWFYRHQLRRARVRSLGSLLGLLAIAAFLPVIINDPRLVRMDLAEDVHLTSALLLLASICPWCAILGYLTPGLIDQYAAGRPDRAGRAYALNVLGCILGPLAACYVLLPCLRERQALILLALPLVWLWWRHRPTLPTWARTGGAVILPALFVWSLAFGRDFDALIVKVSGPAEVRRDYAAAVVATGEGRDKKLLVNGIGVTSLTPITKFMVHLPLTLHESPPESALIICFGMGTSYRSALSWGLATTAVELVPSVQESFRFFHADAPAVLTNPQGRIVTDDGRRFLKRTRESFDLIVVDPSPPVESAGSSLLYSAEFCELAKARLKPGGILQTWFPGGDLPTAQAVARAVRDVFPHVRCFVSVEGWGVHILASEQPLRHRRAEELAARLPLTAQQDLLEWNPAADATAFLGQVLAQEHPIEQILNLDPSLKLTDDRPINEYFLLRRWRQPK